MSGIDKDLPAGALIMPASSVDFGLRQLWRKVEEYGLSEELRQLAHILIHDFERGRELLESLRGRELRHAIGQVFSLAEPIVPGVVITSFTYDAAEDDLIPLMCHNLDYEDWLKEATGKHKHGLNRRIFDTREPFYSDNIQQEPLSVNRPVFIKHQLVAYWGAPLICENDAIGMISYFRKEGDGLFEFSQIARLLKAVSHPVARILWESRRGKTFPI